MPEEKEAKIDSLDGTRKPAQEDIAAELDNDPMLRVVALDSINAFRAWFSLHVISPYIEPIRPSIIHMPDSLEDREQEAEHVYPIIDTGDSLATSKAEEMFHAGFSHCKLYYTIEKMLWLLHERLRSGGIGSEDEVQIAIHGYQSAIRYAFASVINMQENILILNFDPGNWGEQYLEVIKRMAQNYGFPAASPRDMFRKGHGQSKRPLRS
ncbi:MAG: virulence factor [Legionellaceae bacterium]|nr:virulence factor [Legionellaceae bacterium]